ncbi:M1 family peptidase, partial [Fulvivirga sp. RKSG066]|uniref:M1 family metallopeptidase n=1 Tax=Fulvivirga aurantia TaxID=2529383 RepID=UPI0012BCC77D|nr:M1 family peptidase [Fulvivirga aurantia]
MYIMRSVLLLALIIGTVVPSVGQQFNRQDSLRGSITEERAWWDLLHYHLDIKVDPAAKSIEGKNTVTYKVLDSSDYMQIDLQSPMTLDKAMQNGKELTLKHEGNAHFIKMPEDLKMGNEYQLELHFKGKPKEAENAPWDGGITWATDSSGLPFVASANQGIGASVWWPNKDHPYDEPNNGVLLSVEVPENLMNVSNGRLIKTEKNKKAKTKTYHWEVKNPINNYGVNINVGDYVHFGEKYEGANGVLDMDYYVLSYNLEKAKKQFADAKRTIEAFEHWFGAYPFYEDSYKLVEVPYLGMEHQSSVTYGNGYQNGYRGGDLSASGWGLKFDFIIIHETGHEWFANSITNSDVADMWLHESFTAYSENLYLEYHFGKEAGHEYVRGTRISINNDRPIIGTYNVHHEGSGDMYYKGANMLHTIRYIINDDSKWREILRGLNKEFYHQTVSSEQVEKYMSETSGIDLSKVFDQYLRTTMVPTLAYFEKEGKLFYKWENVVENFDMPIVLLVNNEPRKITPGSNWQLLDISGDTSQIKIHPDYYVGLL